jgi:hypothetical protein
LTDVTDTTLTIEPRATKNGAGVATSVAVNADTYYGQVVSAALADVTVGAAAVLVVDAEGDSPNALGIAVYAPKTDGGNSTAVVIGATASLQAQIRAALGKGAAKPPKPVVGKITAVNGAKVTIDSLKATVTATTSDSTVLAKIVDKTKADLVKGGFVGAVVQAADGTNTAIAALLLPEPPAHKGKNKTAPPPAQ